ncbi:MAG: hypothetical protein NW226_05300 [Microscillaceae bacterium]|nr:hypothetical protein [Microscillaceae bacterium]
MLGISTLDKKTSGLFLSHLELIDNNFGFKIGVEYRKLLSFNKNLSPSERQRYEPFISLYIAKTTSFSALADLFSSK